MRLELYFEKNSLSSTLQMAPVCRIFSMFWYLVCSGFTTFSWYSRSWSSISLKALSGGYWASPALDFVDFSVASDLKLD